MSNLGSFIVAIDTASRRGSIALASNGRLVALFGLESDAQQSIELWENLDMLLERSGATIRDVTAFAVTRGPGSFTGLRVGLTATLGFAHATARPLFGATNLEMTGLAAGACDDVLVMLNAHRREVYAQRFRVDALGRIDPLTEPVVAAPAAVLDAAGDGPVRFVGDGAELYRDLLAERAPGGLDEPVVSAPLGDRWQLARAPVFLAGVLAEAAARREAEGYEPGPVEPCYIRPSEAEINLKLGRLKLPGGGA